MTTTFTAELRPSSETTGACAVAEFDAYARSYLQDLNRGLSLSGESKDYFTSGRLQCLRKRLAVAGAAAPARIVDFGCGIGDTASAIASTFPHASVVGLDISTECLAVARKNFAGERVSFRLADEYDLTCDGQFDLLHCNGVLHHVPLDRRDAVARQMISLVKPGGFVCVWENNPYNPATRWVMSRIPFDRDAVMLRPSTTRALLARNGADCVSTAYLFYFPRWLSRLRRLEGMLEAVPLGAQYGVLARVP